MRFCARKSSIANNGVWDMCAGIPALYKGLIPRCDSCPAVPLLPATFKPSPPSIPCHCALPAG